MHSRGYSLSLSLSFPPYLLPFLSLVMVDHPNNNILGIPTGASPVKKKKKSFFIRDLSKRYRLLFKLWFRNKNSQAQPEAKLETKAKAKTKVEAKAEAKVQLTEELSDPDSGDEIQEEETMYGVHSYRYNGDGIRSDNTTSPRGFIKPRTADNFFPNIPSPLSRSSSRRSSTPTTSSLNRSKNRQSMDSNGTPASLSRNASRRSTTPIMYSNSSGRMVKPPPIEKKLECTLEELCYGSRKKIKITRNVITNTGQIIQEEEILTIKVKPGWKKGTKITFEGMGNEAPGALPADVIFVIAEKRHPLFRREGDDLEFGVEIPLVKALTGCTLSIPLLGGEKMSLMIDDIIHPGYERIIEGQGMPNQKGQGKRGNLKAVFLIEFPTELSDEKRSDILSILEDSS